MDLCYKGGGVKLIWRIACQISENPLHLEKVQQDRIKEQMPKQKGGIEPPEGFEPPTHALRMLRMNP